jgi:hypothetical protein
VSWPPRPFSVVMIRDDCGLRIEGRAPRLRRAAGCGLLTPLRAMKTEILRPAMKSAGSQDDIALVLGPAGDSILLTPYYRLCRTHVLVAVVNADDDHVLERARFRVLYDWLWCLSRPIRRNRNMEIVIFGL